MRVFLQCSIRAHRVHRWHVFGAVVFHDGVMVTEKAASVFEKEDVGKRNRQEVEWVDGPQTVVIECRPCFWVHVLLLQELP